jgi:hypothetical protein
MRPGDLSARIRDWHVNVYRVKAPDASAAHNQHFPAIRAAVEDTGRPEGERVGHALSLAEVSRNRAEHTADTALILYRNTEVAPRRRHACGHARLSPRAPGRTSDGAPR